MSFEFESVVIEDLAHLDRELAVTPDPDGVGIDTETTSLDTRRAQLVDISVSMQYGRAFLLPIGHKIGRNLPMEPVVERLRERFDGPTGEGLIETLGFNNKFDRNIKQANTKWVPKKHCDLLNLVYLDNPDCKEKGLKLVAKRDLDYDMNRFESLFTPEEIASGVLDISTKSPERCREYACADAALLLPLYKNKYKAVRTEFDFANRIDTKLIDILRKVEHNGGMLLNEAYIDEQIQLLGLRAETLKEQVYRIIGYQFEINSSKQLGIALFDRMGIPSPGVTRGKNPQHRTDAESLEKLAVAYPIVTWVMSYRKVVKARDTYFQKLRKLKESGLPVRFSFNMFSAPTFRLSAPGGDPYKDGFTGINIQAVSNGEAIDCPGVMLQKEKEQDNYLTQVDKEEVLVDYDFEDKNVGLLQPYNDSQLALLPYVIKDVESRMICIRETCNGCPAHCSQRGIDTIRREQKLVRMVPSVRQAFTIPAGYTLVSLDYDRQELVIGANLSGEPKWINALNNEEDLHTQSACDAYSLTPEQFAKLPKEEAKAKRGIGKILNFAIFYGATAYTISSKANLSKSMGEQIYDRYKRGHPQLFTWIQKVHLFSRKNGYTTTYFGRRRWLKEFYDNPDKKIQAFADRSSVNTAVQGTGAEVTRIAMVKVDEFFRKAGITRKEAYLVMQLHDELTYAIRDELVISLTPKIAEKMAFNVKSWKVQLSVAPKVGKVWGDQREIKKDEWKEWKEAA